MGRIVVQALSALALVLLAPLAASAQAPGQESQSAWLKMCSTDQKTSQQICIVRAELRGENGAFLSAVNIQKVAEGKYGLTVLMPIGVLLPPGVQFQVDGAKKATAPFTICLPAAQGTPSLCIAEVAVDQAIIESMKKGSALSLVAQNAQRKEVKLDVPLTGFTKVFDGPGMDPQAAQARQQELNEALQKRAEEARRKLIEQQQSAPAGAPPKP